MSESLSSGALAEHGEVARIHLPLLSSVRIASPCPAHWEDMVGDTRVRHCAQCNLDVHNIAALTREEAEEVLAGLAKGRVCARFFRRADGTIITRDCAVGLVAARRRMLIAVSRVAAAIGLVVLAGVAARAAQDKNWGNWGWSMRLTNVRPSDRVLERARLWMRSPVPMGGAEFGDVVIPPPPGVPPDVRGPLGSQFGPHEWEYRS